MAIGEKIDSRKISLDKYGLPESATFVYIVKGTSSETAALAEVSGGTSATYGNLVRSGMNADPTHVDTTNEGACLWEVSVNFAKPTIDVVSFDTTGGTQHIQASIYTRLQIAAENEGVVDNHGLIGVTEKGGNISVEGVDITVPVYAWNETHRRTDANINQAAIYSLTGKVNSALFKGFAAGEVLFQGATGSKTDAATWEVTYKFAASPNKANFNICNDKITVDSKLGWEYLWVRYRDDATDAGMVAKPVCAYVESVYDSGDFSALGI